MNHTIRLTLVLFFSRSINNKIIYFRIFFILLLKGEKHISTIWKKGVDSCRKHCDESNAMQHGLQDHLFWKVMVQIRWELFLGKLVFIFEENALSWVGNKTFEKEQSFGTVTYLSIHHTAFNNAALFFQSFCFSSPLSWHIHLQSFSKIEISFFPRLNAIWHHFGASFWDHLTFRLDTKFYAKTKRFFEMKLFKFLCLEILVI